ncbi:hypothetical protein SLW70_12395 [Flavobacterium sp. NG2]|nr:hypothetical protein [Flavobacterium sp. NG2]WPR70727.1 hypothetical protein SLW70_12395 [Flavobacterium sp. NG2]
MTNVKTLNKWANAHSYFNYRFCPNCSRCIFIHEGVEFITNIHI